MNHEEMLNLALNEGFLDAKIIEMSQLLFVPEYRKYCEENVCGKYNKNYSCPPLCGTPEEMKERATAYKYGMVLQTSWEMENVMDSKESGAMKKEHTRMTFNVMKNLKAQGINGIAAMAGGCGLCTPCKYELGEPCCYDDLRCSCISAYCIDAGKMCEAAGMSFTWEGNKVSFYSLFMFN